MVEASSLMLSKSDCKAFCGLASLAVTEGIRLVDISPMFYLSERPRCRGVRSDVREERKSPCRGKGGSGVRKAWPARDGHNRKIGSLVC